MNPKAIVQNPWAGLSPYEDPAKSSRKLKFCGRESEIFDLTRLIDDNFLVTLYGKSGIGKTSLLNAGVFPALRREQYTPLSLRLGLSEKKQNLQDIITTAVERAVEEAGGSVHVIPVVEEQTDRAANDYLWNWFARRKFMTAEGLTTFPVVVFDQFEEVFRQPGLRAKAEELLAQLHHLMDESNAMGDCIVEGEPYSYDFNFRFVLSIREDDLYRLEDSIDNGALTALKRCRYRLRSLSVQGACDAILIPGEGLFQPGGKNGIVRTIIGMARNKEDKSISTNLLSLVCSRIFVDFQQQSDLHFISQSLVDSFVKSNPFDRFYEEATRGFSNKEKCYIEDHLVDSAGRRNSVPESDFFLHVPQGAKLLEGDARILQRSSVSSDNGNYRMELIHDSFCRPLQLQREKRVKRRRFYMLLVSAGVALLCMGITLVFFHMNTELEKETKKVMEIKDTLIDVHCKFVATKGLELIEEHDYFTARQLVCAILDQYEESSIKNRIEHIDEFINLVKEAVKHDEGVLRGHRATVTCVAYSPDGRCVVSGSKDSTVRIWDAKTGCPIGNPLIGHKDAVTAVAYSSDGRCVVSGSKDSTVRIWDAKTGRPIGNPLIGHKGAVTSVAISPDNKHVVSGSKDSTVCIWDVKTGQPIENPLKGHTDIVTCVAFNSNGNAIVSGSEDKTLRIWDVKTGKLKVNPLKGHASGVTSVAYSRDGKYIVSGSKDGTVKVWSSKGNEYKSFEINHKDKSITSVNFSPDGKRIVGAKDKVVCIWDIKIDYNKRPFEYKKEVTSVVFSPDGKHVVWGAADNTLCIRETPVNEHKENVIECHKRERIRSVAYIGNNRIISGSNDGTVRFWKVDDTLNGSCVDSLLNSTTEAKFAFSSNGKYVAMASKNTVQIFIDNEKKTSIEHKSDVTAIAFNSEGNLFVSGSEDYIRIWDIEEYKCIDSISVPDHVNALAFSPKSERVVLGTGEGVYIWKVKEDCLKKIGEQDNVMCVAFGDNGGTIVSSSEDRTICIWNNKYECAKKISELKGRINSLAFSPEGSRFVSGGAGVYIWDSKSGNCIDTLSDQPGFRSVAFSPNGKYVVAVFWNQVHVWDVSQGKTPIESPLEQSQNEINSEIRKWQKQYENYELPREIHEKFYLIKKNKKQ